jgi:hypothetical protein
VVVPVAGYYFLSSIQYGLWSVLEGQVSECFACCTNTFRCKIPGAYYI